MKLVLFLILTTPLILVSIWFTEGYILGAAEAELPFYNLQRFADRTAWAWTDFQLGYVSSFTVASNPTWSFLAWLQNIGIPGFLIQATVIYSLFVASGIGIIFLTREIFPNINPLANLLSVLFYWFNPVSLANVWNRFLYNFMFFFALLPITLYLFIRGIHKRKYKYIIFVNFSILLFSFSLTSYVFNFLIWFVLAYTTFFYSLMTKEKSKIIFNIIFFSLTFILYVLFNLWWILPTLNLFSSEVSREAITSNVFTSEGNLQTLQVLSQKLGNLVDITRLMHSSFYAREGPIWTATYNHWFLSLAFFTITAALFWVILRFKKERSALYLGNFFIFSLFLAKGINPPFGELFKFFFEKFVFLQAFRNPFEKFGFLLPLFASPLFAYGIYKLGSRFGKRQLISGFYIGSSLAIILVFGYPFIKGLVFTGPTFPNNDYGIGYKVDVPQYYKEADHWLIQQGKNFRFIGFPLGGEGITYNWNKGYQGVELSNTLFSTPNILFNTVGWPHYYQLVDRLEGLLSKKDKFYKVANILNAKYLMIRSDINYKERAMRDPKSIESRLNEIESTGEIKKVSQFGNLSFWENLKWQDRTIYPANYLVEVKSQSPVDDVLLSEVDDTKVISQAISDDEMKKLITTTIVHPTPIEHKYPEYKLDERDYVFDISEDGDYDLIIKNIWANGLKLFIDDNLASASAKITEDEKVFYGNFSFSRGRHKLVFRIPSPTNFVNTPDNFTITNINNTFLAEIKNFDPYSKYLGSFDFFIKQGPGFTLGVGQGVGEEGKRMSLYYQFVPNMNIPDFRHAQGMLPLSSYPENASFVLTTDPQVPSEVIFKNLIVSKLLDVSPILKKDLNKTLSSTLPTVSYTKHNPTKYSIKVNNARQSFILILSQLHNPGWKARYQDGEVIKNHYMVNAYANGWLIEKVGDFNLTLEFAPQRLLNVGKIISTGSILGGLMYIGIYILYQKRSNRWK